MYRFYRVLTYCCQNYIAFKYLMNLPALMQIGVLLGCWDMELRLLVGVPSKWKNFDIYVKIGGMVVRSQVQHGLNS